MTRLSDKLETAMKAGTQGEWKFVPWHIEEGPPAVRAEAGWIIATTSSDADAQAIALFMSNATAIIAALRERGE
ncbi:hypothetical protein OOT33_13865 [Sphingobium sp. DEHP117]|uniref:hypothetical protein n=1 Tax=Sphingobium sp. DEHP117 TaxID=2993436 RepID=UPI0027D65CA2|nr:hypothetical protein [Sphingobium sp. DEHP117]MDQ4421509.1 hypothetical protein [Sphingobium sp. DEHP117]